MEGGREGGCMCTCHVYCDRARERERERQTDREHIICVCVRAMYIARRSSRLVIIPDRCACLSVCVCGCAQETEGFGNTSAESVLKFLKGQ